MSTHLLTVIYSDKWNCPGLCMLFVVSGQHSPGLVYCLSVLLSTGFARSLASLSLKFHWNIGKGHNLRCLQSFWLQVTIFTSVFVVCLSQEVKVTIVWKGRLSFLRCTHEWEVKFGFIHVSQGRWLTHLRHTLWHGFNVNLFALSRYWLGTVQVAAKQSDLFLSPVRHCSLLSSVAALVELPGYLSQLVSLMWLR